MELFKEVTILGLNFLKAKKGLKINEKEIEQAKKIFSNVLKGANITADFINRKKLTEPIIDNSLSIIRTLFVISIIVFLSAFSVLLFAENVFTNLLTIFVAVLICRVLLIASLVLISILLIIFYAKIKK